MNDPYRSTRRSRRPQVRDEVAAHIRELIAAGIAKPGQALRLEPLAAELDTSVTPVREALLLLERDGWVVQQPHRGFLVAHISEQDLMDTYFVYQIVAGELAARAAANATPELIKSLRAIASEIGTPGAHEQRLEELNYELHAVIYDAAESSRLVWFVEAASRYIPRRFWPVVEGWEELNATGHGPIIDAIEASDVDKARQLMADHIGAASRLLVAHLQKAGFFDVPVSDGVAPQAG